VPALITSGWCWAHDHRQGPAAGPRRRASASTTTHCRQCRRSLP
jgi:hypothetical protein